MAMKRGTGNDGGLGRRAFVRQALLGGVATGAGLVPLGRRHVSAQSGGEVVVCTWGGTYTEAQRRFFFEPFERETGIRVRTVGVPDIAKIGALIGYEPTVELDEILTRVIEYFRQQ